MPCCFCGKDISSKKKLLLHGKACASLKQVLEEFCLAHQGVHRFNDYTAFSAKTASLCHLCQSELRHYSNLQKNLQTCTTGIIQKLEGLEVAVAVQRKRSSELEEASSPKRPHEAESGSSVTVVQSPRESGQWRSRARRRIHRSPFASRAQSTQGSPPVRVSLYLDNTQEHIIYDYVA